MTLTERAYQQATQTAASIQTATAASPTPTTRQLVEACDLGYVVVEPRNLARAPSFQDTLNSRVVRAGSDFEITITIENASSCDWPLEGGLELVFARDLQTLELSTDSTSNCSNNPIFRDNRNFSRLERPRFFIDQAVKRGESFQLVFSGQAPRNRGCYFGAWQLTFADYNRLPIGNPLLIGIQVFGSGGP
jgi:hypothetical protein